MEIFKEDIHITETLLDESLSCVTEADIIVPDTMPDILKVLKCDIDLIKTDKIVHQNGVEFSGVLDYKILYLADDKTVRAINYNRDFSRNVDAKIEGDVVCYVNGDVTHIEPKVSNSRKLNVKDVVSLKVKIIKQNTVSAVTGYDGDEYPVKMQKTNSFSLNVCKDAKIKVEDVLDLNLLTNGADEILKVNFLVKDTELKSVANKAVARGTVKIDALYTYENEIMSFEYEIPFSEIIEAEGLEPDMYSNGELKVIDSSYDIAEDGNMNVSVDVNVNIRAYIENSYETVADTYSPDYELELPRFNATVSEMIDVNSVQTVVKDSFITENEIEKVYFVSGKPYAESVKISGNKAEISGYIDASLMYKASENSKDATVNCEQKQIPFTSQVQLSRNCDDGVCEYSVSADGETYTLSGENSCDLRFVVRCEARVIKNNSVSLITDVICDESKKIDKSNQAGIIVYFVQQGDTLWDVAKHYNTTDKQIIEVNNLLKEYKPEVGDRLVIPKSV